MKNNGDYFKERELFKATNLCDDRGNLQARSIGWSRNPIINCNLKYHQFRKKKWNYWYMLNKDCLFSVTISNVDYLGMVFAYFYDFNTGEFIEKTLICPLGKGCSLPDKVLDTTEFYHNKMNIFFRWNKYKKIMNIITECKNFNGRNLTANFKVHYNEEQETLNVVIPWSKSKFQFTSKQTCLPVEGQIILNNKKYIFHTNDSFAGLDFGRGVWPFKIMWNWATASGIQDGRTVGFNLGAKWTDGTGITENALFINGKIIKISEKVIYHYDENNLMKPWSITTETSDKVSLKFTPFYDRLAETNAIILNSKVHQMIGEFSGYIKDQQGNVINVNDLRGCAEEHYAKW
ncbi:DUF2804 domain-containing protein [Clostridium niameyense]|uniref:DUF2804 domain-containing protein n=1 Tax=Clostridium niameyense TaxID=1622073 RepID=UPI00067F22A4|nr:DUF2804 domain-containing protein [Clostridium niameyense]